MVISLTNELSHPQEYLSGILQDIFPATISKLHSTKFVDGIVLISGDSNGLAGIFQLL